MVIECLYFNLYKKQFNIAIFGGAAENKSRGNGGTYKTEACDQHAGLRKNRIFFKSKNQIF